MKIGSYRFTPSGHQSSQSKALELQLQQALARVGHYMRAYGPAAFRQGGVAAIEQQVLARFRSEVGSLGLGYDQLTLARAEQGLMSSVRMVALQTSYEQRLQVLEQQVLQPGVEEKKQKPIVTPFPPEALIKLPTSLNIQEVATVTLPCQIRYQPIVAHDKIVYVGNGFHAFDFDGQAVACSRKSSALNWSRNFGVTLIPVFSQRVFVYCGTKTSLFDLAAQKEESYRNELKNDLIFCVNPAKPNEMFLLIQGGCVIKWLLPQMDSPGRVLVFSEPEQGALKTFDLFLSDGERFLIGEREAGKDSIRLFDEVGRDLWQDPYQFGRVQITSSVFDANNDRIFVALDNEKIVTVNAADGRYLSSQTIATFLDCKHRDSTKPLPDIAIAVQGNTLYATHTTFGRLVAFNVKADGSLGYKWNFPESRGARGFALPTVLDDNHIMTTSWSADKKEGINAYVIDVRTGQEIARFVTNVRQALSPLVSQTQRRIALSYSPEIVDSSDRLKIFSY